MNDYTPVQPIGDMFGMGFHFFGMVIYGLVSLVCFVVVVGIAFLLVRFLLVATKAAQLYVAKNTSAAPTVAKEPTTSAPAATRAATTSTPPAKDAAAPAKPATKPRTPKAPPAK